MQELPLPINEHHSRCSHLHISGKVYTQSYWIVNKAIEEDVNKMSKIKPFYARIYGTYSLIRINILYLLAILAINHHYEYCTIHNNKVNLMDAPACPLM